MEESKSSQEFIQVDPRDMYVPPSRIQGADPAKLARQISRYGVSIDSMPPIELTRGKDGYYLISDGVTRAIRAAKFRSGELIPAEVTATRKKLNVQRLPTIVDVLP